MSDSYKRKPNQCIVLLLFSIINVVAFAQNDSIVRYAKSDSLISLKYNCKLYMHLEDALKDPLNVKCLDLKSKGYTDFPLEILQFKNLEFLDLSSFDIGSLYSVVLKSKLEREKYKKDNPGRIIESGNSIFLGDYNPNKIKEIPNKIKDLSKLKFLDLEDTELTKKQVKKLRRLLPNCIIVSDFDKI